MSNSAYWNSQYRYYMDNQPPKSDSYYNQSFVDRMNEAKENIDNLVAEKDKSYSAMNQKQDEYDAFNGTMKSYDDVWKNSKSEFGVEEAKDNYEESKKAIALAESTMEALPSSINNASNRVLTQSQREARYNTLSNKVMRNRDLASQRSSMYEQDWANAREQQSQYVNATINAQWKQLDAYNNAYVNAINAYNDAEKRIENGKIELMNIQSDYRNWQNQQYNNAWNVWYNNMSNALTRYTDALNTDIVEAQANMIRNSSNNGLRDYDFGNGYVIRGAEGKNAQYMYNGNNISAGQFLEATGANGANWNAWNNVWSNGVKTSGVGSDTVEAFNRKSAVGYGYLF